MRLWGLAFVVLALLIAGSAVRELQANRTPVKPLPCTAVVGLVEGNAERVACLDDAAVRACGHAAIGVRYRQCRDVGPLRGPVLRLHDLPLDAARATVSDLRSLPGIGATLAVRLDEARRSKPFCTTADLRRARGVGERRAEALTGKLVFSDPLCAKGQPQ